MLSLTAGVLCAIALIFAYRAFAVLYPRVRLPPTSRTRQETCSLAVFLGSGGHTSEALLLMSSVDFERYTPRTYIVSEGDTLSVQKAMSLERLKHSQTAPRDASDRAPESCRIFTIPRARRVHQSLLATPLTALVSLAVSVYYITIAPLLGRSHHSLNPDVLILNGPGTCFVLCLAVCLNRILALPSPRMIYVESFARVKSLSLSGKLLRPIVDSFIVQWPDTVVNGRGGACHGWLV